jgi:quinol monooxygenase YgiN
MAAKICLSENTVNPTIAVTKDVTTLINVFAVEPENQQKLLELLRENTENVIAKLAGWISTSFIAAADHKKVVIYSQWRDLAAIAAMRTNPEMMAYFPRIAAIATIESMAGDVVYSHSA